MTELNREAKQKLREASPLSHIKSGLPPFLLIHGTKDQLVPYEQSIRMCEGLQKAHDECELFTVEEGGHGMGGWVKNPAYKRRSWIG